MAKPFVLDREVILERLGGDEDILLMMLDMYLQDVDNNCAAIAGAYAAGDAAGVQREAHTIKGLLATFSDDEGSADAFALEGLAKTGDVSSLGGGVEAIQARLQEVARVLSSELGRAG